jgi:serine protease inhibitor
MDHTSRARRAAWRRLVAGFALAAVTATLAAGCGSRPGPALLAAPGQIRGVAAVEPAVSPQPYAVGDLRFGLDLLHLLCTEQPDQDIVLSPASLATSLGLAYLGARGATARAIATVLHLPAESGAALLAGLQARERALGGLDGPGVTVAESNQVWSDPTLIPLRSYLNAAATGYDAGLRRVPLLTDPGTAAAQINAAISAATRGHIRNLVSAPMLTGVGWVLTDALYLKALWATPFSPDQGTPGSFRTAAGPQVRAQYLTGGPFAAATMDGWTAVSLPYRGGRLAMDALLPPAAQGTAGCPDAPATVISSLAASVAGSGTAVGTAVALPEANLSTQTDLSSALGRLGMGIAFTPAADFTGLSPQAQNIGTVVHAATLRVDAQGTVASAATAVTLVPLAERVATAQVSFDRPYLLLVTDTQTSEPLFLARVANPESP